MTPEAQRLVRESFAKVAPIAPAAAAMFYDRLFVLDPALRPLFKGDMAEQGGKLMSSRPSSGNPRRVDPILPAAPKCARRDRTVHGAPWQKIKRPSFNSMELACR